MTSKSLKNELTRNRMRLKKTNTKTCIWDRIIPCNDPGWGLEKTLGSRWSPSERNKSLQFSLAAKADWMLDCVSKTAASSPGKWSLPSVWQLWDHIWSLGLAMCLLGLTVQGRHWHTSLSAAKSYQPSLLSGGQDRWAPLLRGWDQCLFSMEERSFKGDLNAIYSYLMGRCREDRASGAQWNNERQWMPAGTRDIRKTDTRKILSL